MPKMLESVLKWSYFVLKELERDDSFQGNGDFFCVVRVNLH